MRSKMESIKQNQLKLRKQHRPSIALNIMIPKMVSQIEEIIIESEKQLYTQNILQRVAVEYQQIQDERKKQTQALLRVNRLMIKAHEINKCFNLPMREGNILRKIFDQILGQLEDLNLQTLKFDHRQIFKNMFEASKYGIECRGTIGFTYLDAGKYQEGCDLGEKASDIATDRIYSESDTIYNLQPQRRKKNQENRVSLENLSVNFGNLKKIIERSRNSLNSLETYKNIDRINYNLTWDTVTKEYHRLLISDSCSQTSKMKAFMDTLNENIKKYIADKEATQMYLSLTQNFSFVIRIISTITFGMVLLMVNSDSQMLWIQIVIILVVLILQLVQFANKQIDSQASYREWINQQLVVQFQSSDGQFMLELDPESLDIRVLPRTAL